MADIEAADALFLAGSFDAAADAYRRMVAAGPDNGAAWRGLGGARLKAGAHGDSCDALRHALRLEPMTRKVWLGLAKRSSISVMSSAQSMRIAECSESRQRKRWR